MQLFETKLIWNILSHLPIAHIGKICSSLTAPEYQQLCKEDLLWQQLLVRDYEITRPVLDEENNHFNLYQQFHHLYRAYGVFRPILDKLKNNISCFNLSQHFTTNPLYNSVEFREIYTLMSEYLPKIEFYDHARNITIIPTILRPPYTPFVQINFQLDLVYTNCCQSLIDKLQSLGYQIGPIYGGIGAPPLYLTLSGKMDENRITFKIPVMDSEITQDFERVVKRIRGY